MGQPLTLMSTSTDSSILIETSLGDPCDIDKLTTTDSTGMATTTPLAPLSRSPPAGPFGKNYMTISMLLHQPLLATISTPASRYMSIARLVASAHLSANSDTS